MVVTLDPSQCYQDNPHFRQDVELVEESTDRFAEALKKISVIARKAIEADKAAVEANLLLAEEIANVVNVEGNTVYETESFTVSFFNRISQVLKQAQTQREQQLADLESSILQSIQKFLTQDLSEIKKTRAKFDADYQDYESELMKYCAISKKKEAKGSEETQALMNSLRAAKKTFHATSLYYCGLLNEITATRKLHFLESLVSYAYSLSGGSSKLHKAFEDIAPMIKDITIHIQETKGAIINEKKTEQNHATLLLEEGMQAFYRNLNPPANPTPTNLRRENSAESQTSINSLSTAGSKPVGDEDLLAPPEIVIPRMNLMPMEGFLLKRSSGARKTWSRRYFILNLEECRLDYLSPKDSRLPIVAMYLIGASLRESESDDRRFVLNISSPTVHYYLQAETEGEFNDWKQALTASIQHGPAEKGTSAGSPKKLMPSTSFTSITSGLSAATRSASGKTSNEALEEVQPGSEEKSGLLKSGDLLFKKGAKKTLARTLTKNSSQMELGSTSSNEWKRVFASLSKDSRLVLFESDKEVLSTGRGSVRKLLTKVVASVDLSSLENHAIQSTHDSITGRRYSFSIQTKERTIYLAGNTQMERDEWVLICNRHLLEKNHDPGKLRTAATISVEIHEARGIPSGDPYCEIKVDEMSLATTSAKSKTSTPYWGEDFCFDDIREVDIGVLVTLKNQNNSRIQKDSVLGHCFIPAETLLVNQVCEGWYPLVKGSYSGKPSSSESKPESSTKMEIKINVRYQTVDVMPLEKYKELSTILEEIEAEPTFEIAKLSTHLEGTARNLLRIFLGKGTVSSWLKKLVGTEILLTDNANVMFRANSIATKAIDQYMKVVGMEYLERTIGDVVRTICESKYSCEVDPTRLQKGEDLNQNWTRLIGFVNQVWSHIAKSANDMPKEFRAIFSHIQRTAHQKFGLDEAKSTVRYTTVSGFLFLRFFCPAVLTPKFFGLLNEHPDERTRRTLTLITKTLQCLANLGNFSVKEEFMQRMNEFLMEQTTFMMDFIDEASRCETEPEGQIYPVDLERELGEFHHFISNNRDTLRQSKTPRIKALLLVIDKLDSRLDSMSKLSLGAFLNT